MPARTLLKPLAAVFLALVTTQVIAQTTEPELKTRLLKRDLYLRGPWGGHDLSFDATGTPLDKYDFSSFTVAGVDVEKISLKDGKLVLSGRRIGLEFTPNPKRVSIDQTIRIVIAGAAGSDFGPALDKIFASSLPDLAQSMPSYWQLYARKNLAPPNSQPAANSASQGEPTADAIPGVASLIPKRVGGSVKAPILLSSSEPTFSPAARALKYSGIVRLGLRVKTDGSVSDVQILKPLGLGLDEQAVASVYRYHFKPAMQDETPVMVELNVEVNFQIFR